MAAEIRMNGPAGRSCPHSAIGAPFLRVACADSANRWEAANAFRDNVGRFPEAPVGVLPAAAARWLSAGYVLGARGVLWFMMY